MQLIRSTTLFVSPLARRLLVSIAIDNLFRLVLRVLQGLKKVLSVCPGQADFPAGQVTFHSDLPDEQGIRQDANKIAKDLPRAGKIGLFLV